ncbi:MAG: TraR/DksA C4-type zinc finger protein [Amaricoccus sp.]
MTSIEAREQQLRDRLAALTTRLRRIETELDEENGEPEIERDDDEVLEDLGTAGLQEIRMIEAALDRVAQGSYGICVVCGDPIGEERLDILPHTPTCRDCAR